MLEHYKTFDMKIERKDDEIIIRIPNTIDDERAQRIIDYIRYLEVTSDSGAKQNDVDDLSNEINRDWWENNKDTFLE
jgi:hypothetical protein